MPLSSRFPPDARSLFTAFLLLAAPAASARADPPVPAGLPTLAAGRGAIVPAGNTAPTITDIANRSISEDTNTGAIAFTVGDVETPSGSLIVSGSSNNTVVVPNANIVFGGAGATRTVTVTPAANLSGSATITITVSDGSLLASDPFVLTVLPVNDAPVLVTNAGLALNEGAVSFLSTSVLNVDDVDNTNNQVVYQVTALPSAAAGVLRKNGVPLAVNGTFTEADLAANAMSFAANNVMTDNTNSSFTFIVSDGSGGSIGATSFNLSVTAINDAPAITAIPNQSIDEDGATAALSFTIGDEETASTALTLSSLSSNPTVVPNLPANIAFGGTGPSRSVTVTPAANWNTFGIPAVTVTVTVSDGAASSSAHFTVTIAAVNDAPVVGDIPDQNISQNSATAVLGFAVNDVETAPGALTVTGASSNATLVPDDPVHIVLGGSGASRTIQIVPAPDQVGSATITVSASDGVATGTDTFHVEVSAVTAVAEDIDSRWDGNRAGIVVRWRVERASGPVSFEVWRRSGSAGFEPLPGVAIEAEGGIYSFLDRDVAGGRTYGYRVILLDGAARAAFETALTTPRLELSLAQNQPNPFGEATRIRFSLPATAHATLGIFDVRGRRVRSLLDAVLPAGEGDASWDGRDEAGSAAGAGVYFYRLDAGGRPLVRKMVMLEGK
jgi:hypothetical protein